MSKFILFSFLCGLSVCFIAPLASARITSTRAVPAPFFTYDEFVNASPKIQVEYLKAIRQMLVTIEKNNPKSSGAGGSRSSEFFALLSSTLIPDADAAAEQRTCVLLGWLSEKRSICSKAALIKMQPELTQYFEQCASNGKNQYPCNPMLFGYEADGTSARCVDAGKNPALTQACNDLDGNDEAKLKAVAEQIKKKMSLEEWNKNTAAQAQHCLADMKDGTSSYKYGECRVVLGRLGQISRFLDEEKKAELPPPPKEIPLCDLKLPELGGSAKLKFTPQTQLTPEQSKLSAIVKSANESKANGSFSLERATGATPLSVRFVSGKFIVNETGKTEPSYEVAVSGEQCGAPTKVPPPKTGPPADLCNSPDVTDVCSAVDLAEMCDENKPPVTLFKSDWEVEKGTDLKKSLNQLIKQKKNGTDTSGINHSIDELTNLPITQTRADIVNAWKAYSGDESGYPDIETKAQELIDSCRRSHQLNLSDKEKAKKTRDIVRFLDPRNEGAPLFVCVEMERKDIFNGKDNEKQISIKDLKNVSGDFMRFTQRRGKKYLEAGEYPENPDAAKTNTKGLPLESSIFSIGNMNPIVKRQLIGDADGRFASYKITKSSACPDTKSPTRKIEDRRPYNKIRKFENSYVVCESAYANKAYAPIKNAVYDGTKLHLPEITGDLKIDHVFNVSVQKETCTFTDSKGHSLRLSPLPTTAKTPAATKPPEATR